MATELEKEIRTIPITRKKKLRTAKRMIVELRVGTGCHALIICCLKA